METSTNITDAAVVEALAVNEDAACARRRATTMLILQAAVDQAKRLGDNEQMVEHEQALEAARTGS